MRRTVTLGVLLTLTTLGLGAQSLADLLNAAVGSDPTTVLLKDTLERTLITVERTALEPGPPQRNLGNRERRAGDTR